MRKRFILLNIFIVLSAILAAVLIFVNARHYTLTETFYAPEGTSYTAEDAVIRIVDGKLTVEDLKLEDGKLSYVVKAVEGASGDDSVEVIFGDPDDYLHSVSFYNNYHIGWFGTVFHYFNYFDFDGFGAILTIVLIDMLAAFGVTLWSFCEKWKRGEFSHAMSAYGGIAIFLFSMVINCFVLGSSYGLSVGFVMWDFANSGKEFLWLFLPVVLVFAVSVTVSNISLMRNEGFRPVNALGIIFSVLMIGGRLVLLLLFGYVSGSETFVRMMTLLENTLCTVIAYMESMLFSTIICALLASKYKASYDKDYLVILGCALMRDGTPTPLLRMRADAALRFEREQYEKTGKHAVFVPSGGQGSDEIISEGESVSRYLMEQGVPEEQIAPEMKSVNTRENLLFSKKVIEDHAQGKDFKTAFATTNYHVFRSYIFAEKAGLKVEGISAKTKWYFFPNAFLREFIGLLASEWKNHLVFLLLVLAFFAAVNLVAPM